MNHLSFKGVQRTTLAESHRVLIYCCSECGDVTCGGITVKIQKNEDSIEWSDFAYENNYDEKMTNRESFMGVGPFKFAVDEYMHTIDLVANFREE